MKKFNKKNFIVVLTALVLIGNFAVYQIAQAATAGEGSASINIGGSPAGGVTVDQGVSQTFTVILTVGTDGITADALNPTFTIPTGFTAPSNKVASVGAVSADGDWFAVGGSTCAIALASSSAS